MIFALGTNTPPSLVVMLSESDVADKLRPGNTLYVDPTLLKGNLFGEVILSMHKTDQDAIDLLQGKFPEVKGMKPQTREPRTHEARCSGPCKGVMPFAQLFEGKCIVCWSRQAKALLRMVN